jgi:hypothetical protein
MVNPHAWGEPTSANLVLHLRRLDGGQVAATCMDSFERVWGTAKLWAPGALQQAAHQRKHSVIRARQQGFARSADACRECSAVTTYSRRYRSGSGFASPSAYCADLKKITTYMRFTCGPMPPSARRCHHALPQTHFAAIQMGIALDPDRVSLAHVLHDVSGTGRMAFLLSGDLLDGPINTGCGWAGRISGPGDGERGSYSDFGWYPLTDLPANMIDRARAAVRNYAVFGM